ncbi:MAG: YvcK family protein [Candidatus Moranbacteria bacterium]|nr:YvcK family protein [Candidatus Moranbacteria bacterium]
MKNTSVKKVVTIGGGTGSFALLSGLKKYPIELSAIVSMADDGGSTGILRDELGVLPPGDVRQCLVALSDSSLMLRKLMNYRFENGGLAGHSFGNLFLSALEKITGNFTAGVAEAAKILNVKGEVIPVTNADTKLFLQLKNKILLHGESEINHNFEISKHGVAKMYLSPKAKANPRAIEKILAADLIVIGPGSHYCAIVPNLLVEGIPEAIRKSRAKVVYNCNLVNKKGQTEGFTLDDYIDATEKYLGKGRIDFVTHNRGKPSQRLMKKYKQDSELVSFERTDRKKRHYRVLEADLLSTERIHLDKADAISHTRAFIRHDSDQLAKMLMLFLELGEYEGILRDIA